MEVDYQKSTSRKAGMFFSRPGEASHVSLTHTSLSLDRPFLVGRFLQLHSGNSANSAQDGPFSAQVLVVAIAFFPTNGLPHLVAAVDPSPCGPAGPRLHRRRVAWRRFRRATEQSRASCSRCLDVDTLWTGGNLCQGRKDGEGGEVIRSTQDDAKGL